MYWNIWFPSLPPGVILITFLRRDNSIFLYLPNNNLRVRAAGRRIDSANHFGQFATGG